MLGNNTEQSLVVKMSYAETSQGNITKANNTIESNQQLMSKVLEDTAD